MSHSSTNTIERPPRLVAKRSEARAPALTSESATAPRQTHRTERAPLWLVPALVVVAVLAHEFHATSPTTVRHLFPAIAIILLALTLRVAGGPDDNRRG